MSPFLILIIINCAQILCNEESTPKAKTKFGVIEGTFKTSDPSSRRFSSFEGIPYAVSPIESLRFKPPKKLDIFYPPNEPLKAEKLKKQCPQLDLASKEYTGHEDCLYLNVFSPETKFMTGVKHPVMVWIHGGAFQLGSSLSDFYGPERLLDEDVVLVTLNYRLGALGFLTTGDNAAPGNVGLLDQRMALEWVRDNIDAFAGDPERVTLFGESAGGMSVMAHLASPGSQGLFHGAIAQSGIWGEMPFLHNSKHPAEYGKSLARDLGCSDDDSELLVKCLQSKDPKKIIEHSQKFATFDHIPEPFIPVVDNWLNEPVLPQPLDQVWAKIENIRIPLMIGGNKDEGVLFIVQFLKNGDLYKRVNENFSTELPALLLGVDPDDAAKDEGETATAETLRNSYLPGDGQMSSEVVQQMIRLFTDVHFLSPIDQVVRQLSGKTEKLFYYNYQHKGSFSLPTAFGIWENYGVSHCDELFFLFRVDQVSSSWLGDLALQTEEDLIVQKKLVKLWTNFAKTGSPTQDESWKEVDARNHQFAVIDADEIRMEYPEEFAKKMELVQQMVKLARVHRVQDAKDHPELKKMREELVRLAELEWEEKRNKVMKETMEKQKEWRSDAADIEIFDEDDDADLEHDEL